ncbi:MAG: hypothetical protein IJ943_05835 [Akkermansia sp.]|nr:hypothetical protein [Akkermansia sp.]
MNSYTQSTTEMSPWRVMLCVCAYSMMAMYSLFFLLGMGSYSVKMAKQYAWLLRGEIEYADDWTPAQRVAVERFVTALKTNNDLLLFYVPQGGWEGEIPEYGGWDYAAYTDELLMPLAADIEAAVRKAVQGGKLQRESYGSLAHVAADMWCLDAARAFIEHDSSVLKYETDSGEDLLSLTLSNHSVESQQEVFEMADWLMEQGVPLRHSTAMLHSILASDSPSALMEWLLAKGLPLEPRRAKYHRGIPFDHCVSDNQGVDVFTRLVREGKIDINDRRGRGTYLQLVVEDCADAALVEQLLKLGAQPDLLPEPYSIKAEEGGEYTHLDETPVAIVLRRFAQLDPEETDEGTADYRAVLCLLFRYGAAPQPLPAKWAHDDNRRMVEDVYREFGHPITTQPSEPET